MVRSGRPRTALLSVTTVLLALLASALLAGCYGMGGARESAGYYGPAVEETMIAGAPPSAERAAPADRVSGSRSEPAIADLTAPGEPSPLTEAPSPGESPRVRLRVFSADLELVVASVEQSRSQIIAVVEAAGGYVESSREDFLVVRVPAESFDATLESIESAGDVRSRFVSTADVTDQYADLEARLRIAETSRERLLQLLERTEDADERVAILREIRRLTEEIERLRSALESLSQLVRYSRITVQLISRIQMSQVSRSQIPFPWIAYLAPLDATTREASEKITVALADSFAVFSVGKYLHAEAADGTVVRAGAVTNDPAGNESFWQSALAYHLGPYYQSTRPVAAGPFRGVLLESKDTSPFFYLVMAQSRGTELIVMEVFFPDESARDRRLPGILDAAGGAE